MNCAACRKELELVFPSIMDGEPTQFENALAISFHGGYGMFFEDMFDDYGNYGFNGKYLNHYLCHECAHKLCEENRWINDLIKPILGHSHKPGSVPKDHKGWDIPNNKE